MEDSNAIIVTKKRKKIVSRTPKIDDTAQKAAKYMTRKSDDSNTDSVSSDLMVDNSNAETNDPNIEITEHSCLECPKSYSSVYLLEIHQRLHEPYVCLICNKTFATLYHMREHIVLHHDYNYKSNEVCCRICSYPAIQKYLVMHLVSHVLIKEFKCRICSQILKRRSEFWEHIAAQHKAFEPPKNIESLQCGSCGKVFKNRKTLSRHLRRNSSKLFQCTQCPETFITESILKNHLKLSHSTPNEEKECTYCLEKIPSYNYEKHIQSHEKVLDLCCALCDKYFKTKNAVTRHNIEIHLKNNEKWMVVEEALEDDDMEQLIVTDEDETL